MKKILLAVLAVGILSVPADAASLSKTYSYFSVGGKTLAEIEIGEVDRRSACEETRAADAIPALPRWNSPRASLIRRHGGWRASPKASVSVRAKIILPRWRQHAKADVADKGLILGHALGRHQAARGNPCDDRQEPCRDLELALPKHTTPAGFKVAAAKAKAVSDRILAQHERAQREFDRVEGINFESLHPSAAALPAGAN